MAARALNVDEHLLIKTLVMKNEKDDPLLILMHGDKKVSTKSFARTLGVKTVSPCNPQEAHRHTGYFAGGISPFGTKKPFKVYVEDTILDLPKIYINAGRKGLLAEMSPRDLARILKLTPVKVSIGRSTR